MAETTRASASFMNNIELMFDLDTVLTGADDFGYYDDIVIPTPPSVVVAALPTVAGDDDVCAVCMEDFRPDEGGKQISCGHVYHEICISSWLSIGDCCPLCRRHVASGDKAEVLKTVQV